MTSIRNLSRGYRTLLAGVAVTALVALGACGDDTQPDPDTGVDSGLNVGQEASIDLGEDQGIDALPADGPLPDVAIPDGPVPDAPVVDGPLPDAPAADGPAPDAPAADATPGSDVYIPTGNTACSNPVTLTLVGGQETVQGDTTSSTDEFATIKCGTSYTFKGPQLYYKLLLSAGKTYKIQLTPGSSYDAALYAFPASTACTASDIDSACAGYASDLCCKGKVETIKVSPNVTEEWMIVADSYTATAFGTFVLTVEEFTAPGNQICVHPTTLMLTNGSATVAGDTSDAVNEYGTDVKCGYYTAYQGPQLYYKLTAAVGKTYRIDFSPSFSSYMYVFPSSACGDQTAINAACGSAGVTGDKIGSVTSGTTKSLYFTPTLVGPTDYIIAVDSSSASTYGAFTLTLNELDPPPNGTCLTAQALTLANGTITVTGDTAGAPNELTNVKCGGATAFAGPQLYYKVAMSANQTYRIKLSPLFTAYLYVFSEAAACNEAQIETDCASGGATGAKIGSISSGKSGEIMFTPTTAGNYIIAVDSSSASYYGGFTLTVSDYSVPTFTAPLSWDFETDCQGLAAMGDWECGQLIFPPNGGPNCDSTSSMQPPTAGHSGTGVWGTKLNDCYSPLDNAGTACTNPNPGGGSVLSFKVTLPASWTMASMTYWGWDDYFLTFDWAEIRVNGQVAKQFCTGSTPSPMAWTQQTVDLSSYVGQTVLISFHLMATSVVNYSGWYIDDLAISGS